MSEQPPQDMPEDMPLLDAKKMSAVVMLAEGKPKTVTAKELKMDRATLYDWLKTPDFQKALEVQQRRINEQITDPTTYVAGLVNWKARLPEMMSKLMDTACDTSSARQARAAEIILAAVTPDKLNVGKTQDEVIIAEFLKSNGIAAHPTMQKSEAK